MALLADLQRVFENTYARAAGVDLEACVVGRRRFAELEARSDGRAEMSDWARFFYYVEGPDLRLALFFDPAMIEALEASDPRRSLDEANVVPFVVLAEELSHAVHTTFAFREGGAARIAGETFLAELELLARIDAYLVLKRFVWELAGRYAEPDRAWVLHHAVTRWDVPYDDPALGARYRSAARLARRFVDHLETLPATGQLVELRRFRDLSPAAKRHRLARLN